MRAIPEDQYAKEASENVTRWLRDAADRSGRGVRRSESDAALLTHLEQLAGRKISTRDDLQAYIEEVAKNAKLNNAKRQQLRSVLLMGLLVVAVFQYYFIDVQLQILSQPGLTVFVPTKDASQWPILRS